jgi:nucleoid DNA-binding protein
MFPKRVDNEKIAEKLGMPVSDVNKIIDEYFLDIKEKLLTLEYFKVIIPRFGSFEACQNPLQKFIDKKRGEANRNVRSEHSELRRDYALMQYNNALNLLDIVIKKKDEKNKKRQIKIAARYLDKSKSDSEGDME